MQNTPRVRVRLASRAAPSSAAACRRSRVSFAAPAFLARHRARAGRAGAQPGRGVSERRQRRAEHRRAVSGSVLLQPPADDCHARGAGAADRHRLERAGARAAPAAHRAARDLQRRPARGRAAHRLPELEPLALPGLRHLGHGATRRSSRRDGWLGRYLETLPDDRAARMVGHAGAAAGARVARGQRAGDSRRARPTRLPARTSAPKRSRERAAATRIASHLPVERPHLAFVNAQRAGGASPRSIAWRRWPATPARVPYPNNGFALALRTVAGAIVRGIGTRVFWVQTGGFDTHAGQGAAGGGALRQPDGHLRRRRCWPSTTTCATRAC